MSLQTIGLMKESLAKEGLKPHLMVQPLCYHAPDGNGNDGYLPETPFGEWVFPYISNTVLLARLFKGWMTLSTG